MKKLLIAAASVAALSGGIVLAQTQTEEQSDSRTSEEEAAQNPPDPRIIAEELRAKAKRIPRRNLAAALRAARDDRDDRARTIVARPNLDALRADLRRTEAEDSEREAAETRSLSDQSFTAAPRQTTPPPPPPGIRAMSAGRLRTAEAAEVERARIPVLLPAELRDRMKIYGMENIYTATARIDARAQLSISGTCNRVVGGAPETIAFRKRIAEGPRRLAGTGASYQISRNDFGVDLSFSKFGCGYVMTIECGDPGADPRCAADDYITGLAQSMILANPELAGGE
ncbi:hypothetical protein [Hyphococcus sp.]|uniref:hypothetical protein n=1 Tax=Hyphococcus sp. TaxID=2038636 RepID=UPI0035C6718D